MPYRRRYPIRRRRRFGVRSRARVGRPRRSFVKRRSGRRVTRRSILNASSVKKHDTLPTAWQKVGTGVVSLGSYTFTATAIPSNGVFASLWCCSARSLNAYPYVNARNSSTVFVRGLREDVLFTTADSDPWMYRRVVFSMRGSSIEAASTASFFSNLGNQTGQAGYTRLITDLGDGSTQASKTWTVLDEMLFKGNYGVDYQNVFHASTRNDTVTVHYDRTIPLRSQNDTGTVIKKKFWHGFNKNLTYLDQDSGGTETTTPYSVHGRIGLGDVYVLDLFIPYSSATTGSALVFQPQSTWYWHEK